MSGNLTAVRERIDQKKNIGKEIVCGRLFIANFMFRAVHQCLVDCLQDTLCRLLYGFCCFVNHCEHLL